MTLKANLENTTIQYFDSPRIESYTQLIEALDYVPQKSQRELLYCKSCWQAIATEKDIIQVNNSHDHNVCNPDGLWFHIGCFRLALGCHLVGKPSQHHTWFPSFNWQHSLCSYCHNHLGWYFEAPNQDHFFALILDKISEDDD
ncbi:MAG: hypothetical protein COB51_06595 [Moraxellaceae bacterium]|nr:MAG: hypothetical protein COB51_06595 [Moraxellaceae bacterium]